MFKTHGIFVQGNGTAGGPGFPPDDPSGYGFLLYESGYGIQKEGTFDLFQFEADQPTAYNIDITGSFLVASTLTFTHSFFDPNGAPESGTTYQLQRSDDLFGDNVEDVPGATASTYVLTYTESNKYLRIKITPSNGITTGFAGYSAWEGPVFPFPASVFIGHVGGLYDPLIAFQDTGATTRADDVGESIARINDQTVNGFNWLQATAASRLTLGQYPIVGIYNYLIRTQELDNAAWTKTTCTITANTTVAPDGTLTADTITATGATGRPSQSVTFVVAVTTIVYSCYFKKGNTSFARIRCTTGGVTLSCYVNLDTGAIGAVNGPSGVVTATAGSVTAAANGFTRLMFTLTTTGVTTALIGMSPCQSNNGNSVNGDTVICWGAQTAQTAHAYQKVAAAYDVTESGIALVKIPYGAGDDFMSLGVGAFGAATSGFFAAAPFNWFAQGVTRVLADGTLLSQRGAVDATAMFSFRVLSGNFNTMLRGTANDSGVSAIDGLFHRWSLVCTNGVVTLRIDNGSRVALIAGVPTAEIQNILMFARTELTPANFATGFGEVVDFGDYAPSVLLETNMLADIKAKFGGP